MTTRANLAKYGVTLTQAHDFIKGNLGSPATIYQVAKQFGVDSQMLADIMSIDFPGLSAETVEGFFQNQGLAGAALHNYNTGTPSTLQLLKDKFTGLSGLVSLNQHTGDLSNEALRAKVVATTGLDNYKFAFAPFNYQGNQDGTFSAQDLGVTGLTSVKATWENMESLCMGTAISMLEAIDQTEMANVKTFIATHKDLLDKDDDATLTQLRTKVIDMFNTPVTNNNPYYTHAEMVVALTSATTQAVTLIGQNTESDFLGVLLGQIVGA